VIDPSYLYWFVHSRKFTDVLVPLQRGNSPPAVLDRDVYDQLIPIAPLAEQRRIVARIDELFTEIADGETLLARARDDLDTWRRALLKAAVTGELTREWREGGEKLESGRELLTRIENQRGEIERRRRRINPPLDASELPALPEDWAWARAGDVCGFITKGTTPGKDEFCLEREGGVPFIKVYNLTTTGDLDFTVRPSFVRPEVHHGFLARSVVKPNDVLMNNVGPPLGKVSIVPDSYSEWNCNQAI
jgi:type I restriction enzyme S subunit